jgi:hypothetical protein
MCRMFLIILVTASACIFLTFLCLTLIRASRYYQGYLRFFVDQVNEKGASSVLEDYIFSDAANGVGLTQGETPSMLVRFMDFLVHPVSSIVVTIKCS